MLHGAPSKGGGRIGSRAAQCGLEQQPRRIGEEVGQASGEAGRLGAIDDAMVVGHGKGKDQARYERASWIRVDVRGRRGRTMGAAFIRQVDG